MTNEKKKTPPSIDEWLREAKADPASLQEGMFLVHNGVVRETPRAKVRQGIDDGSVVRGMEFSYDTKRSTRLLLKPVKRWHFYVRVWLNEGKLEPGDDIMYVLIGGDIRPHVIDALQFLVEKIKSRMCC